MLRQKQNQNTLSQPAGHQTPGTREQRICLTGSPAAALLPHQTTSTAAAAWNTSSRFPGRNSGASSPCTQPVLPGIGGEATRRPGRALQRGAAAQTADESKCLAVSAELVICLQRVYSQPYVGQANSSKTQCPDTE